ncbi:hypothetical protein [Fulvivirga lutea]|uniref:Uncharacterized protein n=1 Tax=Fulvivirga lutea TaxID=2810512 RepID=A0A974WJT8_9BACT|nr:hypothetical protein [Fulvivirga lutea]QSE96678.1 hypothetical protein JR347_13890 [Fulvivirga lutea]
MVIKNLLILKIPTHYKLYKYNFDVTPQELRSDKGLQRLLKKKFLFTDEGCINMIHKVSYEDMTLYKINSSDKKSSYYILSISTDKLIAFARSDEFVKFLKNSGVKLKVYNSIEEKWPDEYYKVVFIIDENLYLELEHFGGGQSGVGSSLELTEITGKKRNKLAKGDDLIYGAIIPKDILKSYFNLIWEQKCKEGEVPERVRKLLIKQKAKMGGNLIMALIIAAILLFLFYELATG